MTNASMAFTIVLYIMYIELTYVSKLRRFMNISPYNCEHVARDLVNQTKFTTQVTMNVNVPQPSLRILTMRFIEVIWRQIAIAALQISQLM